MVQRTIGNCIHSKNSGGVPSNQFVVDSRPWVIFAEFKNIPDLGKFFGGLIESFDPIKTQLGEYLQLFQRSLNWASLASHFPLQQGWDSVGDATPGATGAKIRSVVAPTVLHESPRKSYAYSSIGILKTSVARVTPIKSQPGTVPAAARPGAVCKPTCQCETPATVAFTGRGSR
eukprot:1365653-Rhodomonas_salina.1